MTRNGSLWWRQMSSVASVELRLLHRRRSLAWSLFAAILLALPALGARFVAVSPSKLAVDAVGEQYLSLLVYLLPLALLANSVGSELRSGTLAYVLTRPLSASAWVAGKTYGASLGLAACLLAGCTLALLADAAATSEAFSLMRRWASWAVAIVALLAYVCAVCFFWSAAATRSARLATAAHLLLFEWLAGRSTSWIGALSMHRWLVEWLASPPASLASSASSSPASAPCLPLLLSALLCALATLFVRRRDYRFAGN